MKQKRRELWRWSKGAFVLILCLLFLSACAMPTSKQGKGTAWGVGGGAAAGGILGQVFGGNTESTLWGAAIGAALGGLTGNQVGAYMDRQEAEFAQVLASSQAASMRREGEAIVLSFKGDVYFDTNKSIVNPGMFSELDRVASVLTRYPNTWIEVGGHADPRGSAELNRLLSQRRADSVARELVNRRVDANRLKVVGYGESQPVSGGNPDMYGLDRRVVLKLFPMK